MNVDWLARSFLAFPGVTEQIQWGSDLHFKVGGKMLRDALEPAGCAFPSGLAETFADLTERPYHPSAVPGARAMGSARNQGRFAAGTNSSASARFL